MTFYCIGRNYVEHAKELNNPVPKEPLIFCKPSTAALKDNKAFYIPDFSQNIHHEVEILLRIGRSGKKIKESEGMSMVSHIGLGIDFTARDIQDRCKSLGHPWEIAKAFDHSAVVGDWIPLSEIPDGPIHFVLQKNKIPVQKGSSINMIFNFSQLISAISQYFTLLQGDVIFTGTPEGVGQVQTGDLLEGYIGERRMFWTEIK
ncbi:MAG: fumarylacetoacetate hydrolase family protein [Saprospiraceae bacterium]|nr:fumarylacetoacetate hydrolase family protein [Saprospiraceae bacterium]